MRERTEADDVVQGAYNRALLNLILPPMRRAAKDVGYAITVHGSLNRDIDLVAIPSCTPENTWRTIRLGDHIADAGKMILRRRSRFALPHIGCGCASHRIRANQASSTGDQPCRSLRSFECCGSPHTMTSWARPGEPQPLRHTTLRLGWESLLFG